MIKTRVIPCLLLMGEGLYKTRQFDEPVYVGDPLNAVRLFNEMEVHELLFLDITATARQKKPPFALIQSISEECYMPLSYGGGIHTMEDAVEVYKSGVEKICFGTAVHNNPQLVRELSKAYGSSGVITCMDVRKNRSGDYDCYVQNGKTKTGKSAVEMAKYMQDLGAGEIIVNNIDRDGMMNGYDLELLQMVSENADVNVIACGGAGHISDFKKAVEVGKAQAVSAGSLFVFYGKKKAVLINFPEASEFAEAAIP